MSVDTSVPERFAQSLEVFRRLALYSDFARVVAGSVVIVGGFVGGSGNNDRGDATEQKKSLQPIKA